MALITVFQDMYGVADPLITTLLADKYAAIVALVRGPLLAGITIYIVTVGYATMRGVTSEPWGHLLANMVRLAVLWSAVTGFYGVWVAQASVSLPNELSAAVGGAANPGQSFDNLINVVNDHVRDLVHRTPPMWDNAVLGRTDNIATAILGGFVALIAYAVCGLGLGIVLFAKLALAIVVVFGPIFVALLLFESTRGMFFGWLAHALHYVFLTGIMALLAKFGSDLIIRSCNAIIVAAPAAGISDIMPFVFALVAIGGILTVVGLIFMQAPGIANMAGGGGGGGGVAVAAGSLIALRSAVGRAARAGATGRGRARSNMAGIGRPVPTPLRSSI
jgi:type IV secretion system protein VirB6